MITEPSLVGNIGKKDDLSLLSHDTYVKSGLSHLEYNNNIHKKLMNNLTNKPLLKLDSFIKKKYNRPFILVCVFFLLSISTIFSQSLGDYRSINSGPWTTLSTWESYNGSSWVSATSYPGQNSGTNDVSIGGGDAVSLSSAISNSFSNL